MLPLLVLLVFVTNVDVIQAVGLKGIMDNFFELKTKKYGMFFKQQPGPINLKQASVDEAFYMGYYTSMVYCPDQRLEKFDCAECKYLGKSVKLKSIFEDIRYESKGAVLVDMKYHKIVLSFRGSINLMNWIQNGDTNQINYPRIPGAKVHKGFYEMAQGGSTIYTKLINELMLNPQYSQFQFSVVGHSLGGAIAILAALELHFVNQIPWSRIEVFTYGQPRTGNVNFTNFINQLPIKLARVVNENDLIPHLVPDANNYVHHGIEMYISNNQTQYCLSQTQFEAENCSLSRVPFLSVKSHNMMWDYNTGIFGCYIALNFLKYF